MYITVVNFLTQTVFHRWLMVVGLLVPFPTHTLCLSVDFKRQLCDFIDLISRNLQDKKVKISPMSAVSVPTHVFMSALILVK